MKCEVPGEYDLRTSQRWDERRLWSLRLCEEMASVIIHSQLRGHDGRQCCCLSEICCVSPGLTYCALPHLNPPVISSLAVMNLFFFSPETVDYCPSHRVTNKSHKFQGQQMTNRVQAEDEKKILESSEHEFTIFLSLWIYKASQRPCRLLGY